MANTTTMHGSFVQIVPDGTTDWLYSSDLPVTLQAGIRCKSIQFNPSAANDVCIIHDDNIDGAAIFHVKCTADTDQRIKYFDPPTFMRPVLDASDCTFSTAANVRIIIEVA